MAILPIYKYPDPVLKQIAAPVADFNQKLKTLAADMIETMRAAPGVGLAAPQVGHSLRMAVINEAAGASESEGEYRLSALVLVNPRIVSRNGELMFEEACLSVDDCTAEVTRSAQVVVEAQDLDGHAFSYSAEGPLAVVFQHELDHLDGILFIDRLGPVKRDLYKRRLKKMARQARQN